MYAWKGKHPDKYVDILVTSVPFSSSQVALSLLPCLPSSSVIELIFNDTRCRIGAVVDRKATVPRRQEERMPTSADMVGAITANGYMLVVILMFVARLVGWLEVGRWLGLASSLVIIPLIYLLIVGFRAERSAIYFVWLGLMLGFALFELIVDDLLRVDFRSVRRAVVPYVMFFFGATGGMIGVASQAGKPWTALTIVVFLVMAALAFIQRAVTGL
jgi:hypothetical protein